MATTKAAGTAKNLNDSNPKYLGVKRADGESVGIGEIIVRQRGTVIIAGKNIGLGKDHTLFSRIAGIVKFRSARKINFDGKKTVRAVVDVISA
jgi:large subunit ribosomal protein L27